QAGCPDRHWGKCLPDRTGDLQVGRKTVGVPAQSAMDVADAHLPRRPEAWDAMASEACAVLRSVVPFLAGLDWCGRSSAPGRGGPRVETSSVGQRGQRGFAAGVSGRTAEAVF